MDPKSLKRHDKLGVGTPAAAGRFSRVLLSKRNGLKSHWNKNCTIPIAQGSPQSDAGSGNSESETLTMAPHRKLVVRQPRCRVPTPN